MSGETNRAAVARRLRLRAQRGRTWAGARVQDATAEAVLWAAGPQALPERPAPPGLTVRVAVPADLPALLEVQERASGASMGHVYSDAGAERTDAIAARWREAFAMPNVRLAVAVLDGRIVGVNMVGGPWLHALQVVPEHWGTGVAAALHDDAVGAIADRGERRALIWVLGANGRAHSFWSKHGWVRLPWPPRPHQDPPHPDVVAYGRLLVARRSHRPLAWLGQAILAARSAQPG